MIYNTLKNIDLKAECCLYMAEQGLPFNGKLVSDGKIHRYSADEKRNKLDEWYAAFEGITLSGKQYLNCVFGSWSDDSKYEYKSFVNSAQFTENERIEIKKNLDKCRVEAEKSIKESYDNAASEAQQLWDNYNQNAPSEVHLKYLKAKGIDPIGVRFGLYSSGDFAIILPIRNIKGQLRSLQYIAVSKTEGFYKRFLLGGEIQGNFCVIGDIGFAEKAIFIVEGYATAVSVHKATNIPVVIAFSAGNICNVVKNIKEGFSQSSIIIAGDDDAIGRQKAAEAANYFGCKTVFPDFGIDKRDGSTDFNDLYQIKGVKEVQAQLLYAIQNCDPKGLAENYLVEKEEPCGSFRLSSLPVPLREYVSIICKTTNAHPIIVTSSVLTMASAFVGTRVYVSDRDYFQNLYPNLWMLTIAGSGQFKSTALMKGAKIAFDNQSKIFKTIKMLRKNTLPSKDDEGLAVSLKNVILPTKQTAEGFLEHLSVGHQGAVYAGEFGGWLQNLDKTHNNDFKAILTEFYDVPPYYRYKTKTQGDCIIETPYISICGVSTMAWIRMNLKPNDVSSGFFARFLIFVPPYQKDIPPAFPKQLDNLYEEKEQEFKTYLEQACIDIGESRVFTFAPEARVLIERFHEHIYLVPEKYSEKAKETLEPYLKRWSPYLIKLSMLVQLFIDSKIDVISDVAVISAMSILIPAMKSTASLFEGELGESKHQRKCTILFDFIYKKIKETGKPVKRHMILSSKKLEGGVKEYDEVLQTLIEQGRIGCSESKLKNEFEYYLIEKK